MNQLKRIAGAGLAPLMILSVTALSVMTFAACPTPVDGGFGSTGGGGNNSPPGSTPANPINKTVTGTLGVSEWTSLLNEIAAAGKYAALDLSACTVNPDSAVSSGGGLYNDGTFDTGRTVSTGKDKIVSLILPSAAVTIQSDYDLDQEIFAFTYFTSLAGVTGAGVTDIEPSTFIGCTSLTAVNFPAVTTIGQQAFNQCGLTTIHLPASLTSIAGNAFFLCTGLTTITVDAANSSYSHSGDKKMLLNKAGDTLVAFPSASGAVSLPVTGTTGFAFAGCAGLTTVDLPSAASIGEFTFSVCPNLTMVSLPSATSIGEYTFSYCPNLTMVSLPSAASIGRDAFAHTSGTALTVTLGSTAPTLERQIFYNVTEAKTVTVKVPSGAAGYGTLPATYSGNDTTVCWGNGFRGGGWDGSAIRDDRKINTNITLTIEEYTP
ncbi:MAG: leucine-rich repeat domain-containing protein [Spirochaetaceae bacterium]|jgi:hypothetical protein|nr:leucine-rich repeat domain-containing protein [Spirochaetaceae bacterium]